MLYYTWTLILALWHLNTDPACHYCGSSTAYLVSRGKWELNLDFKHVKCFGTFVVVAFVFFKIYKLLCMLKKWDCINREQRLDGGFQKLPVVIEKQTVACDEVVQQKKNKQQTCFLSVWNKQLIARCVLVWEQSKLLLMLHSTKNIDRNDQKLSSAQSLFQGTRPGCNLKELGMHLASLFVIPLANS